MSKLIVGEYQINLLVVQDFKPKSQIPYILEDYKVF
jgi:hypothetical protein